MAHTRTTPRFVDPEDSFQKFTSPGATFVISPVYKHVRDLLSEEYSKILKLLDTELKKSEKTESKQRKLGLHTAWDLATYKLNKLKRIIPSPLPDECLLAVIVYTMSNPDIFKDFNKKCREIKSTSDWKQFEFKSLYALLVRALQDIIPNSPDPNSSTYYRGMSQKITNLKVGDVLFSKQFLSCSVRKDVAEKFIGSSHGTLITIEGCPLAACGIAYYSVFPDEQELLIFPWNVFKVSEIKKNQTGPRGIRDEVKFEVVGSFVKDLAYSGKYIQNGIRINNS